MPARKKRPTLEEELLEVSADPERLKAGLQSGRAMVVAKAASLIKDHRLEGFDDSLQQAFRRFLHDPVKTDPGCRAKLATLEALDFTESADPAPFLSAVGHVQLEPAWGPPVDTATGVRSRGIAALARLGHGDLILLASEALQDPEPPVRMAAADALAHYGLRHGAGPLLLKLAVGDDDPLVTLACMSALITLAPDVAVPKLAPRLSGKDLEQREVAALALGQSGRNDALDLLTVAYEGCVMKEDREVLLRALGLHRSDAAAAYLLTIIAEGREADARAAVIALGARRFEPGMRARVLEKAQGNEAASLGPTLAEAFPEEH